MALLLYNAIVIPLRICFDVSDYCPSGIWLWEAFADWFFVADLVLNFFTGVVVPGGDGTASSSPAVIARHYLRSWFVVDLISSVPLDFFITTQASGCAGQPVDASSGGGLDVLKLVRMLRLIKLFKLFRLLKISKMIANVQDHIPIPPMAFQSLYMVLIVSYAGHIFGCLFYSCGANAYLVELAATDASLGAPMRPVSWLQDAGYASLIRPDVGLTWSELLGPYTAAVYWAFTTMTTVGYGDLTPQSPTERIFASCAAPQHTLPIRER